MIADRIQRLKYAVNRGLLVLAVVFVLGGCSSISRQSQVMESRTFKGTSFEIQVTSNSRVFLLNAGPVYKFRSRLLRTTRWNEILSFEHDDLIAIEDKWVHFVNDEIAFVYIAWMYAVTTDRGQNWSVWGAHRFRQIEAEIGYNLIKTVTLNSDGTGKMKMGFVAPSGFEQILVTSDYGRSWHVEEEVP